MLGYAFIIVLFSVLVTPIQIHPSSFLCLLTSIANLSPGDKILSLIKLTG